MSPTRLLLAAGPATLSILFLIRVLVPSPDPLLLLIFTVLAAAVAAMARGIRLGAGAVLVLSLALFQPVVARDISFSLSSVDSASWRLWAIATVLTIGVSIVSSLVALFSATEVRWSALGFVGGVALGVGLLPVFSAIAPHPGFGGDLDDAEIAALPVIELLNFRYEPPIVSVGVDEIYRAKLDNPSNAPHTVTIDSLDLEVYVPAGRWAVIEIDGRALAEDELELYCSIGDHRAQGMQALLEIEQ